MDLPSILLILAVAVLVALFISRPFSSRRATTEKLIRPAAEEADIQRSTLLAERDRVLTALQDLEFDYTLGKIPAQDYPVQRTELMTNGADVLRKLDELAGVNETSSAEDRLEAVVAARRADASVRRLKRHAEALVAGAPVPAGVRRPPAAGEDEIEALVSARRLARQEKAGGFCPSCGRPVAKSDRFCSKCGAAL